MMTRYWTSRAAVVAALAFPGPAMADVTANEVWQDFKATYADMGVEMTATEETTAQGLSVRDMVMRIELPEDEGTVEVTVPGLSLSDKGDGTVEVSVPDVMPITVMVDPADDSEENVEITLEHAQTGFSTVVSGTSGADMNYAYSAAESVVRLTRVVVDGEPQDIGTAMITLSNIAGVTDVVSGAVRAYTSDLTIGALSYDMDFVDPENEDGFVRVEGTLNDLTSESEGKIPEAVDYREDMAGALRAGFGMAAKLSYGSGNSAFSVDADGVQSEGTSQSAGGTLEFGMAQDGLRYGVSARDVVMNMTSSEMPFPVAASLAEMGLKLTVPVSSSEERQEFGLSIALRELSVPEQMWAMVDPGGQLPHDPATLHVDLGGNVTLEHDMMDAEKMEELDQPPGKLHDARINALQVSVAGAELTGDGAFTFDNSDLQTFDGMPRPEGKVSLRLEGAHALLDKLTAMGLIPEDQVTGTRMMLGLFSTPAGDDVLTSDIEVTPDGKVLANGERIK